jgi:hypothetical protein
MQAMGFARLGMRQKAQGAVQRLLALYPDFPAHARVELARWVSARRAEASLAALREAGLEIA